MATPRLAEPGSWRLSDSPSQGDSDSLTSRVGSYRPSDLLGFLLNIQKLSRRVSDSPTCRVGESPTPQLALSESRRLSESEVVFQLRISPQIRNQTRNGSKGSVRDPWGTNFCKNPRKSASLSCPFKQINYSFTFLNIIFFWVQYCICIWIYNSQEREENKCPLRYQYKKLCWFPN